MSETFQSGLFLIKDTYFPFDSRLNVRHILEKTDSFLKDHRVGGIYFSRLLINRCSYHSIDARIVLCLLQLGSGLLSRSVTPENPNLLNLCLGLKPGRLPAQVGPIRTWGMENQIEAALLLLKRFKDEGSSNQGTPIMVEDKVLNPLNSSTYAVCSVVWLMGGGFREILKFRKVYRELFQTKEHGQPGTNRPAKTYPGSARRPGPSGYSNP